MKVLAEHYKAASARLEKATHKEVQSKLGFVANIGEIVVDQVGVGVAAAEDLFKSLFHRSVQVEQIQPAEAA